MTAFDRLRTLFDRGVQLSVRGDRLVTSAPAGALAPEDLALLRRRKNALLDLLIEGGEISTPLSLWDELSTWRWGPALHHDLPSIIIDHPDPARMRAATESGLSPDHPSEMAQYSETGITV